MADQSAYCCGLWDQPLMPDKATVAIPQTPKLTVLMGHLAHPTQYRYLCTESSEASLRLQQQRCDQSRVLHGRAALPFEHERAKDINSLGPSKSQHQCLFSGRFRWTGCIFLSVLTIICLVSPASSMRRSAGGQMNIRAANALNSESTDSNADIQRAINRAMRAQVAQMERQEMLEATAVPVVPQDSRALPSTFMQVEAAVPHRIKDVEQGSSMADLGTLLTKDLKSKSKAFAKDNRVAPRSNTSLRAYDSSDKPPFSFINWGQIGGMMQNPAIAHTGMTVYVPRKAVGTTVGLDFDSPATFHGPLLVALMVLFLIFFLVLMLCCWMVKSKEKHDKYMAEKIPRR
ncbi:hypothetical protein cyc_02101 [Cyclospora cayetanensis]|uniref:Transmembrane protein n=2 Tax=Cyclospora cayetanensis TaxID=88456 RepID=A0A1D3CWP6_9EIME|nr:hypothetical protein cyc_02101 [Cyclospora cayetanensis]